MCLNYLARFERQRLTKSPFANANSGETSFVDRRTANAIEVATSAYRFNFIERGTIRIRIPCGRMQLICEARPRY